MNTSKNWNNLPKLMKKPRILRTVKFQGFFVLIKRNDSYLLVTARCMKSVAS